MSSPELSPARHGTALTTKRCRVWWPLCPGTSRRMGICASLAWFCLELNCSNLHSGPFPPQCCSSFTSARAGVPPTMGSRQGHRWLGHPGVTWIAGIRRGYQGGSVERWKPVSAEPAICGMLWTGPSLEFLNQPVRQPGLLGEMLSAHLFWEAWIFKELGVLHDISWKCLGKEGVAAQAFFFSLNHYRYPVLISRSTKSEFLPQSLTWGLPIVSAWLCSLAGSRWPWRWGLQLQPDPGLPRSPFKCTLLPALEPVGASSPGATAVGADRSRRSGPQGHLEAGATPPGVTG